MPSILQPIRLDFAKAEKECAEFRRFLDKNATFKERAVVAHLKKASSLTCLLGSLIAGVPRADVYKFEFAVLGAFRADFVVGDSTSRRLVFVEFEGGEPNSLFGPTGTAQMRDWSKSLEHGFGQLIDWAWALKDGATNPLLQNAFGFEVASFASVVICGRDSFMDVTERRRFDWRAANVAVGQTTSTSTCLTYDGLLAYFESTIAAVKSLGS
ncbi:Shedu anti-phage system protein SduA domain-containing protein [Bradyrhizobium oligotrophicum]|uniref:Shedu anti-phage system protein SduA domain-containing protein n=1 Tax=Bradyrhizobium oligotrophicum TaxID=44255 RepID=UPI003EBE485E